MASCANECERAERLCERRHLDSALQCRDGQTGSVATVDSRGRTIFVADAHRGDGKRFIVRADEKLTAFLELESVVRAAANWLD